MSHDRRPEDERPEDIFRTLRARPVDEADSETLWRRVATAIDAEPDTTRSGLLPGWSWALAGVGAAALVLLIMLPRPPQVEAPDPSSLVLLTPPAQAAAPAGDSAPVDAVAAIPWDLDVRLIRGYEGAVPADALADGVAGAGGASALADLGAQLSALPFPDFALVGRWRGGLAEPLETVPLATAYRLQFEALEEAPDGGARLLGVRLQGAGRPRVASEIVLHPGRVYLFGVQGPGEDVDAGSLVLALRVRSADDASPQD